MVIGFLLLHLLAGKRINSVHLFFFLITFLIDFHSGFLP